MKSPADIRHTLARQWRNADLRVARLLGPTGDNPSVWPIDIAIGLPSARQLTEHTTRIRAHIESWRTFKHGEILWQAKRYRGATDAIELPSHLRLHRPTDWVAAASDPEVASEFGRLSTLVADTDPLYHETLIRRRALWRNLDDSVVVAAAGVADRIEPGLAAGRPLRLLNELGVDTKFVEQHDRLLTRLLDLRFDDEVSRVGLRTFLGAQGGRDHWLLVVDLDRDQLPFSQIRVRAGELATTPLGCTHVVLVENEACVSLLPRLPTTMAVLGSGLDTAWTAASWLRDRRVAYWGDIDTWGLKILADIRANVPDVNAILMDHETFASHLDNRVEEPTLAAPTPPTGLSAQEQALYHVLLQTPTGRLEQEFIRAQLVHSTLNRWRRGISDSSVI